MIPQWRELLVSPIVQPAEDDDAEFSLGLSRRPTHHSRLLPEMSDRYPALLPSPGSIIEISPDSYALAEEFARRVGRDGSPTTTTTTTKTDGGPCGAALIIDYGPSSTVPTNSLRGIRGHRTVSPFSSPGLVDVSADVDFTALAEAALNASARVEVHGPVEQGSFLQAMGIRERAQRLLQECASSDQEKWQRLDGGWKRLIDRRGGMGKTYKAMAIVPASGVSCRPTGFGGDVVV